MWGDPLGVRLERIFWRWLHRAERARDWTRRRVGW